MEQFKNAYRVLVGKPESKRPLRRPTRRCENNIKMDLRDVGCDPVDRIDVTQDLYFLRADVYALMNLRDP